MTGTSNSIDQNTNQFLKLSGGTMSGAIEMGAHQINGVADPTLAQDAATKNYVDTVAQGLNILPAAYAATTGPLNATYLNGSSGVGATLTNAGTMAAFSSDGTTPPINSIILVKDQNANPFQNGPYILSTVGSGGANWILTRPTWYDQVAEINPGDFILINNGEANAASGWIQTATVATIGTDAINFSLFSSPKAAVNQNSIIGGNFSTNPWQRGTTFTSIADGKYAADRFRLSHIGAAVFDVLKTTDAPTLSQAGIFTQFCFDVDVTVADAAIGAADFYAANYRMEGYDWSQLAQRPFTLSFWVKSTITGTYSISLGNNSDRSITMEYTVNTTNTWEKKVLVIPASPSSGTWDYSNGLGLDIWFDLAMGSNSTTSTIGSWINSIAYGSSNQVNGVSSAANNFKLQLVKIEPGPYATAWPVRSFEDELALCQRYYEKSYNQGVDPGTNTSVGVCEHQSGIATTGQFGRSNAFAVSKRATPSTVCYDVAGTAGKIYIGGNNGDAAVAGNPGMSSVCFLGTRAAETLILYHWTADADL